MPLFFSASLLLLYFALRDMEATGLIIYISFADKWTIHIGRWVEVNFITENKLSVLLNMEVDSASRILLEQSTSQLEAHWASH
jgi:hypothetical protein